MTKKFHVCEMCKTLNTNDIERIHGNSRPNKDIL